MLQNFYLRLLYPLTFNLGPETETRMYFFMYLNKINSGAKQIYMAGNDVQDAIKKVPLPVIM